MNARTHCGNRKKNDNNSNEGRLSSETYDLMQTWLFHDPKTYSKRRVAPFVWGVNV